MGNLIMPIKPFSAEIWCCIFSILAEDCLDESLKSLCLVSKQFRTIAQPLLFRVLVLDDTGSDKQAIALTKAIKSANLGHAVRALTVKGGVLEGWTDDMETLMDLVRACQNGLEELSLENTFVNRFADLIAIPAKLRILNLFECGVWAPSSDEATPPNNSVQFLAVENCNWEHENLSPSSFISLQTFSFAFPADYVFYEPARFMLALPSSLKALRIHADDAWKYSSEDDPKIDLKDWKKLFARLTELETFEVDFLNIDLKDEDGGDDEDEEEEDKDIPDGGLVGFLLGKEKLTTLKLFISGENANADEWEEKIAQWLSLPKKAPSCFSTIRKLQVLKPGRLYEEKQDFSGEYQALRKQCAKRKIELEVQQGWYSEGDSGPFWEHFTGPGKRWLKSYGSSSMHG